jgi:hypothetical protein
MEQWHKNGLCSAGMSINSRSGKSRALDISYFLAQVMPKFTNFFGMTFAKIGHIEHLKFAGTEMNQHSGKHRPLGFSLRYKESNVAIFGTIYTAAQDRHVHTHTHVLF